MWSLEARVLRIEVDEEVYAVLERNVKGFEQPNDVLRRLLLPAAGQPMPSVSPRLERGALGRLLEAGLVAAGDTLTHVQARKKLTHHGVIEPDGYVKTARGTYREPSPALRELVGTSIDGWRNWVHDKTGKTLRQLRDELPPK